MDEFVVECASLNELKEFKDLDISTELLVYPCCAYHGHHVRSKTFSDKRLDDLPKNWNSLNHHSMDEILRKWSEVVNFKNWENIETCPPLCYKECGKKSPNFSNTYREKKENNVYII
jgi:hypothetical protein